MPLTILHISTRLILGGSQENTILSCEGQARLGHRVRLAFGPIYGPEGSLLERVRSFRTESGAGIATHEVPHLVRQINPWADMRCYAELKALVRALKPDIVHTHSSKAGIIGRAAAWNARWAAAAGGGPSRAAVVHTIHGPPFHRFLPKSTNAVYVAAERFAARRCHLIVSVAAAMRRQFLEARIGRPAQYRTVYSGMETERFLTEAPGESRAATRRALGLSDADLVIGTVARLAELKGHDDLLDALADDLRANPGWKLLWVGDGWWRERLMKRVAGLGLSAQVLTTGLVPPQRVPQLIRAMDILAHPSYREGLPRTVPQALLCGVCPVAYDVDGTGEVCRDLQTGRLVAPGDRAGLREAIVWLARHPAERAAMAQRGREECRERFSAGAMVRGLESVYQEALRLAGRG